MLLIFLFNCQEKKDLECSMYNQKVSSYMNKLTRLKQSAFFEGKNLKFTIKLNQTSLKHKILLIIITKN